MQTTERPTTGRPRGSSPARGVVLVAVAAVLGFFILRAIDDTGGGADVADTVTTEPAGGEGGSDTTAAGSPEETTPSTRPAGEIIVLVANGSGVEGAASRQVEALRGGGYQVLDPANAPANVDATQVWATSGFEADAAAMAAQIGAPEGSVQPMPNPPPMDSQGAHVLVILGPDLAAAAEG
jgi:LytR cell envelope-related transcriptional attenuator